MLFLWEIGKPRIVVSSGGADLYSSVGFSTDVKGLPELMQKIKGGGPHPWWVAADLKRSVP